MVKYENVQNKPTKPGSHSDHLTATGLYEQVDGQPEISISVIETKVQGHNTKHDENNAFEKSDEKNVYDELQINKDDHPYSDMEQR